VDGRSCARTVLWPFSIGWYLVLFSVEELLDRRLKGASDDRAVLFRISETRWPVLSYDTETSIMGGVYLFSSAGSVSAKINRIFFSEDIGL